jgi:hypothetical protein
MQSETNRKIHVSAPGASQKEVEGAPPSVPRTALYHLLVSSCTAFDSMSTSMVCGAVMKKKNSMHLGSIPIGGQFPFTCRVQRSGLARTYRKLLDAYDYHPDFRARLNASVASLPRCLIEPSSASFCACRGCFEGLCRLQCAGKFREAPTCSAAR